MNFAVRIGLYGVLLVVAAIFFGRFRASYQDGVTISRSVELSGSDQAPVDATPEPEVPVTAPKTNITSEATAPETTNNPAKTNEAPAVVTPPTTPSAGAEGGGNRSAPSKKTDSFVNLGVFLLSLLGLGGLAAWDVARYFGNRAGRAVMADDWIERKDPEYEKAEEEWAKGNHIDAIDLMRTYLRKNPNEQHVGIRIAEIYEKDLGNYLAAALELEEVLKKRLPRERWGWTAIRLSNLYSGRLNQPDKSMALLERIVGEYSETAAAKKARQRLGLPDPETTPEVASDEPSAGDGGGTDSGPNALPKGFRPRK
jgi:TolA-binding protein